MRPEIFYVTVISFIYHSFPRFLWITNPFQIWFKKPNISFLQSKIVGTGYLKDSYIISLLCCCKIDFSHCNSQHIYQIDKNSEINNKKFNLSKPEINQKKNDPGMNYSEMNYPKMNYSEMNNPEMNYSRINNPKMNYSGMNNSKMNYSEMNYSRWTILRWIILRWTIQRWIIQDELFEHELFQMNYSKMRNSRMSDPKMNSPRWTGKDECSKDELFRNPYVNAPYSKYNFVSICYKLFKLPHQKWY